jgi:broad specificity phosphatase PhoE
MSVTIHCIRHGQGFHNLGAGFYDLPDPLLTPEGEAQCRALRDTVFRDHDTIDLIVSSPMTRALQSANIIFGPFLKDDPSKRIVGVPDAQETSDDPCDIGSDPDLLKRRCQDHDWPVDLSLTRNGWNDKSIQSPYSPSSIAIMRRARATRRFLRKQAQTLQRQGAQNINIALVAHGGFLHYLTEDWEDADKRPGTGWVNCEVRSYVFECPPCGSSDNEAHLRETTASRALRGVRHPQYPRPMQHELYELTMQAWERQGLQNPAKIPFGPC